jgi:hypothetical protein
MGTASELILSFSLVFVEAEDGLCSGIFNVIVSGGLNINSKIEMKI